MKKTVKVWLFMLSAAVLCTFLFSCGVDYTDAEVKEAAKELIEASFPINDIYFGKGLPVSKTDSEEAKKFAADNGLSLENVQFLPVTEESPYFSIEEIKEATAKVYSESYCQYLYSMAFEGFSTEDGSAAVYAKYIEDEQGVLTARVDLAEDPLPLRTYDYSTMEIREKREDRVVIKLVSYLDGEKEDSPVSFTLVKEGDGWRLDTPTY